MSGFTFFLRIFPAASIFSTAHNSLLLETPGRSRNSCPHVAVCFPFSPHCPQATQDTPFKRTQKEPEEVEADDSSKTRARLYKLSCSLRQLLTRSPPLFPFSLDCRLLVKQTDLYKQSAGAEQGAQVSLEKVG